MTFTQQLAQWELCRQGLPLEADEALRRWGRGQPYELETPVRLARYVKALVDQCNWEIHHRSQTA